MKINIKLFKDKKIYIIIIIFILINFLITYGIIITIVNYKINNKFIIISELKKVSNFRSLFFFVRHSLLCIFLLTHFQLLYGVSLIIMLIINLCNTLI